MARLGDSTDVCSEALAAAFADLGRACMRVSEELLRGDESAPPPQPKPAPPPPRKESKPTPLPREDDESVRSPTARKLLVALAQVGKPLTLVQIAFYARVSHVSSGFGKAIAELRRDGLIDGPGSALVLTAAGAEEVGEVAALPQRHELFELLCKRLGGTPEAMLRALKKEQHHTINLAQLGEKSGRSPASSGLGKGVALLRRLGFVEGPGEALRLAGDLRAALEPTIGVYDMGTGRSVRVTREGHVKS